MLVKTFLLLSLLLLAGGCATDHDSQIRAMRRTYEEDCNQWQATTGRYLTSRQTGEETLPLQEVMNKRCKESSVKCKPPLKPEQLTNLESMWGVQDPTPEICNIR